MTLGPHGDANPIQRKTLPDNVYDILLDELSQGRWDPETPLSIDGLAQYLGVSPTPVREALARLETTGLVRRFARRGYRVAPPMTTAQVAELVDARLTLETGALERAMKRQKELLLDLEAAYEAHRRATEALLEPEASSSREVLMQYFADDWSFHSAILKHCGNRYIALAVESLGFRVHRMRQTLGSGVSDAPAALEEHRRILEAVRAGDTGAAVEAMRQHLTLLSHRVEEPRDLDEDEAIEVD